MKLRDILISLYKTEGIGRHLKVMEYSTDRFSSEIYTGTVDHLLHLIDYGGNKQGLRVPRDSLNRYRVVEVLVDHSLKMEQTLPDCRKSRILKVV